MKKLFTSLLSLLLLFVVAPTAQAIDFYGATVGSYCGYPPSLFKNTDVTDRYGNFTYYTIDENNDQVLLVAGANCGNNYYGLLTNEKVPYQFVSVDWNTGKITKIADLDADYPVYEAMAYNFSTNKLYGTHKNTDDGLSSIYEINPTDGSYTKVAQLEQELRAMDFNFQGQLYALGVKPGMTGWDEEAPMAYLNAYDKDFNMVNEVQVTSDYQQYIVADWGYGTNLHSLCFDHITGDLYWSHTLDSYQQYIYKIDLETGKRIDTGWLLGMDPSYYAWYAACMFIPFEAPEGGAEAAAPVTDLVVKADPTGALRATLTWKNPTVNFGGNELNELYSVRIYLNAVDESNFLAEVTDVAPGSETTWVDENALAGNNTYVLVSCRVEGEKGLNTSVSTWVGYDVPVWVDGLKVEDMGGSVKITWSPVEETVHGGPLDMSTLRYKVVRMPDEITIVESTTETEVIDDQKFPSWQSYYYVVTASTDAGVGEESRSQSIFTGPMLENSYETNFNSYEANRMWENNNLNDDGYTGYFNDWAGMFVYTGVYWEDEDIKNHNTMLYSPNISLAPGKYKIRVGSYIGLPDMTQSFSVSYGKGKTVEAQNNLIGTAEITSVQAEQKDTIDFYFEVSEKDLYNLSINITSPKVYANYENELGISYFLIEPYIVPLTYDFDPVSVSPENGSTLDEALEYVEFEFPAEIDKDDSKVAIVTDEDGNQVTTATPNWGISDEMSWVLGSIVLADKLDKPGTYTITIPQGMFGTLDWGMGMYETDRCNPEITLTYTLSQLVGIEKVENADTELKVFDMNGRSVKVANKKALKTLNPGVYVVNGKKVVIK